MIIFDKKDDEFKQTLINELSSSSFDISPVESCGISICGDINELKAFTNCVHNNWHEVFGKMMTCEMCWLACADKKCPDYLKKVAE